MTVHVTPNAAVTKFHSFVNVMIRLSLRAPLRSARAATAALHERGLVASAMKKIMERERERVQSQPDLKYAGRPCSGSIAFGGSSATSITDMYTIGHVDRAENAHGGAPLCAALGVVGRAAQREVADEMRNSTSVDVRRASHVHHTPQVGRAQIMPSTSVSAGERRGPRPRPRRGDRLLRALPQVDHAATNTTKNATKTHPRRRHVDVHDLLQVAHVAIGRRDHDRPDLRRGHRRTRRTAEDARRAAARTVGAAVRIVMDVQTSMTCRTPRNVAARKITSNASEQAHPRARVAHRVSAQQRLRRLHGREQHRHEHGKEQKRQQHLARALRLAMAA